MIQVGNHIPNVSVKIVTANGVEDVKTLDFFKDKRSIVFAVPGAFTPLCSSAHLPGYIKNAEALKRQFNIDQIICLSVNDVFVMKAWSSALENDNKVIMMADGNGDLTREMGTQLDGTSFGLGIRSQRYSMVIESGKIEKINMESSAGTCSISSADALLTSL